MRTKLWPVSPKSHDERTIQAALARRRLAVQLRPPVGGARRRRVGLDVRRAFRPVEDVVRRVRDERRAERRRVSRAADVHGGGALRVVLGPVDVRPRGRVEHEVGIPRQRGRLEANVPLGAAEREDVVVRERVGERMAELAARARDQDTASRAERIGVVVLHRFATRGSFHGTPCSSGSSGSYSSVTW